MNTQTTVVQKTAQARKESKAAKRPKSSKHSQVFKPKFVSTIAALSLCVSSAVAHHPNEWSISQNSGLNHDGQHTSTVTNLDQKIITTKANASGEISSLIINANAMTSTTPNLEVGSGTNNNKITVPKITIGQGNFLNKQQNTGNQWNIMIRGGSTIESFENNGTITSKNQNNTIVLQTDNEHNAMDKGGQTVIKNFVNKGTIKSEDNNHAIKLEGAKIETFTNEQNMLISAPSFNEKGNGNAILLQGKRDDNNKSELNASIETFINKGTITSTGGKTQDHNNNNTGNNAAIKIMTNDQNNQEDTQKQAQTTIKNFTNSGTISSEHDSAIWLKNTHIATFVNESGGIIESKSTIKNDTNDTRFDAAISIDVSGGPRGKGTTIESFDNKGTIKGRNAGIYIWGDKKQTITHFKNSGLIEVTNGSNGGSGSSGNNITAGIKLGAYGIVQNENAQAIPTYHTIENTGTIRGGQYGIHISGGTINNLINSGTIEGKIDGIAFYNTNNKSGQKTLTAEIKNITIKDKGVVKGDKNGINISKDNSEKDSINLTNINIEQGATVEGTSGSGLVLGKSENGQSQDKKYQIKGKIQVDGTLKGATAITNYGELGTDGQEAIVIGSTGQIQGGFKNDSKGTFKGNITNNSSHNLEIDNKGKVGNQTVITNKGSGNIEIKDWKLEKQDNNGNALKALKFEGDGGGKITLEKLTVDVTNADVSNENLKAAFQGNKMADAIVGTQVVAGNDNGAVSFSGDLLRGLVANIDGSKTAAAALNRTLITTATARATFLDSVMGNALNTLYFLHNKDKANLSSSTPTNLYANASTLRNDILSTSSNYASNKNNLFFVLPYYSYTKVELDKGVFSKGHTQGLVLGYSFFNPKS
ncbi:hypothetical protein, partial [Helicobacter sp. 10-6591]|uniref:hypothetical protein n=1 Tax=Helicobacter sp. 10-6591 TaxID=2004998 RepID=UPI000DCC8F95